MSLVLPLLSLVATGKGRTNKNLSRRRGVLFPHLGGLSSPEGSGFATVCAFGEPVGGGSSGQSPRRALNSNSTAS